MALIVLGSRRTSALFPAGYVPKSILLGDVFPGFNSDIIPLCISSTISAGGSASSGKEVYSCGWGTNSGNYSIGGIIAFLINASGGGEWRNGSYTSINGLSTRGSASAVGNGIYLPHYFRYNWKELQNTIKSGTVICWLQKGNKSGSDPTRGYRFKSIMNGDVFPGFTDKVIPITGRYSVSGGAYDLHGSGQSTDDVSFSNSVSINGKTAISISGYEHTDANPGISGNGGAGASISADATGYQLFLPYFYNFDYAALKAGVKSGTISDWLEKL